MKKALEYAKQIKGFSSLQVVRQELENAQSNEVAAEKNNPDTAE